jgi:uncharacterized membrane protein YuzA (DUF378 family)
MINNDTVVTASLFGITAGITTQSVFAIIVGAIAVGVVQPFFRVLWTKKLNQIKNNKCPSCKRRRKRK